MLWEEMEKYTKLTGEDAIHVPIMKIGAYLDGYEKGTEVIDKIRAEMEKETDRDNHADEYCDGYYDGMRNALAIIDKYKGESM